MREPVPATTTPPCEADAKRPAPLRLALCLLAALLLFDAPAMERSAAAQPPDAPGRAFALRLLAPVAALSRAAGLGLPRVAAEALERRFLETPVPVFPEGPEGEDGAFNDDDDLDAFLDF